MKKTILIMATLAMVIGLYSSCYYDNEEALYPKNILTSTCDTTNVTFSGTILPIIQNYCSSCHSSTNANANGGGFPFETYQQVSASASTILASIKHTNAFPMPQNGGMLDECKIAQVQKWIDKGKLNN